MEEKLENSPKYQRWKKRLEENGLQINSVEEKFTRRRYNGDILFSTLMLDADTPEGDKIPPICFLKGEVVCVCMVLIDSLSKDKYLLLVKQRRIAEGGYTYEHPAGMVDGSVSPEDIAIQEVREETGISIERKDLIHLNRVPLFPSTGTSDEAMYFFAVELTLSTEEILRYDAKKMGTTYEFERITTKVLPFVEAHSKINNTNGLLLNYLYLSKVNDFKLLEALAQTKF